MQYYFWVNCIWSFIYASKYFLTDHQFPDFLEIFKIYWISCFPWGQNPPSSLSWCGHSLEIIMLHHKIYWASYYRRSIEVYLQPCLSVSPSTLGLPMKHWILLYNNIPHPSLVPLCRVTQRLHLHPWPWPLCTGTPSSCSPLQSPSSLWHLVIKLWPVQTCSLESLSFC